MKFQDDKSERSEVLRALVVPAIIVVLMVISHFAHLHNVLPIRFFGLKPLDPSGLPGIFLTVFAHKDWEHLISNSIPLLLLGWALFFYYREFAYKALIIMWLTTGIWVWFFGRPDLHIGASGLAYALASFHVVSAILRREFKLMAFGFLVVFLYGSMVWGFFPSLFPNRNISFESHILGALAGLVVAFYYRKIGLQKTEIEDDDDDDEDNFTYLTYHYKQKEDHED